MSPSWAYAFADWYTKDTEHRVYWVDVAGKRCLPLPPDQSFIAWTANDYLLTESSHLPAGIHNNTQAEKPVEYTITRMNNGQLRAHHFTFGPLCDLLASPDGSKMLFLTRREIVVYDLQTDNMQRIPVSWPEERPRIGPDSCWWQSANVIGYLNPRTGQRVLVQVNAARMKASEGERI